MGNTSLPTHADVVIIGGGVIGASVAWHLCKQGIRPLLLEKGDMASGSSGACDGFVFLQSKKPGIHLELAMRSRERFPALAQELDFDVEYENRGGLVAIETEAEFEAMRMFVEKQRSIGLDVSLLDNREARERVPALSENIAGATFCALDGHVNPIRLTLGFAEAAQKLGAGIFPHTPVTGLDMRNGRVHGVFTSAGKVETRVVVNAAGVYAPEIGKMAGLDLPVTPRRGQLLVSEDLPKLLPWPVLSAAYIAAKFNPELAKTAGEGISVEQTASGNILMGSTREFAGFDRRNTIEGLRTIARNVARIFPRLRDVNIIRSFAGLRPYTPDGLPLLGTVPGIDGLIIAAGHEGDGIALSPVTGELVAELIATGRTSIPLDAFKPLRFKDSAGRQN